MKNKKVNDQKPYGLQKENGFCQKFVVENFWIELLGFNPLADSANTMKIKHADYNVRKRRLTYSTSLKTLKDLMKKNLLSGRMLQFAFLHPHDFHHWALITHYYPRFDSFRVINAQLLTNENPVEYLTFEQLTKAAYHDTEERWMRVMEYQFFNKKEGTNNEAKFCVMETKIITPSKNVFKNMKKPKQSNYFLIEH
jgi:hypothetical protein